MFAEHKSSWKNLYKNFIIYTQCNLIGYWYFFSTFLDCDYLNISDSTSWLLSLYGQIVKNNQRNVLVHGSIMTHDNMNYYFLYYWFQSAYNFLGKFRIVVRHPWIHIYIFIYSKNGYWTYKYCNESLYGSCNYFHELTLWDMLIYMHIHVHIHM